jgi:hypothetical protein
VLGVLGPLAAAIPVAVLVVFLFYYPAVEFRQAVLRTPKYTALFRFPDRIISGRLI